jgi:Trk K+ transport system NAD-binding subunit
MDKTSWRERFLYWFDNTISKGPLALISWLVLITLVVILGTSVIVWLLGIGSQESFSEQMWSFLMLTLEPDAITFGHWVFRVATLAIVFTSIFVLSTLIGILTTGIDEKLVELRRGRSRVLESKHTVILGWSSQVFPIISELVIANENQQRPCVVVLGDHDKVQMEREIRERVGDTGRTRVICRSGNPMEMGDLQIANLNASKSIIILAPPVDDPDAVTIKILLAIAKNPDRRPDQYHIVAEIHDPKNIEVAKIVAKGEAEFVLTRDIIARITAQTCRQSGLSVVYTELMDFAGDEIYFQSEPKLVGKEFGEALLAYEDSAVIGLKPAHNIPMLNPAMDTVIQNGDEIIAISEDDDTIRVSDLGDLSIKEGDVRDGIAGKSQPEHTLILGWNSQAFKIIQELDHYAPQGSIIIVLADHAPSEAAFDRGCDTLSNLTCHLKQGDTTDRETLEELGFAEIDHVILLAYSDDLNRQQADACTLITLLHLRDIADKGGFSFSIVSEMLDIRNRDLAEATRPDDFIVSDRIISLILSQISENKSLGPVFENLFDPVGSEIYLKPVSEYIRLGRELNLYSVVESVRRRGEIAIGYRLSHLADDPEKSYGVVINPAKSTPIVFQENDKIIVLAES